MRSRRLIVITPEGEREFLFVGRLRAGRAAECDISLVDTKASRHHAEFDASGPVPRVTDLGSCNGIRVNGHKVASAELAPGDVVTVGDARIRLVEQAPMTATTPATPVGSTAVDDRTAVLSGPPMAPDAIGSDPKPAGGVSSEPPVRAHTDQSTAVMPPPQAPPAEDEPEGVAAAAPTGDGRTTVLPAPRSVESGPVKSDLPPSPSGVGSLREPIEKQGGADARVSVVPAPSQQSSPAENASRLPGALPSTATAKRPRLSWGGLVTLTAVLLGGLAVLLGALPVLSVASGSVDLLSRRQPGRWPAGWRPAPIRDPAPSSMPACWRTC